MNDKSTPQKSPSQRTAVRRTAWLLAALAVASYATFLISVTAGK